MRNIKPYEKHLSESSDFSYLEQLLYVARLETDKGKKMFVFSDEADAESMEQKLHEENPYMEDARRRGTWQCASTGEIDTPEAIKRALDETEDIDAAVLDKAYKQLSQKDREVVDENAISYARYKGSKTETYTVWIQEETMGTMLERLREIADRAKSMDEVLDRFGGDLSWVPESLGLVERIRKSFRSRQAFGRF